MQIIKEKDPLKKRIKAFKDQGLTIGFVPTMGALHEGHLSLMKIARLICDRVVVSIFVNPTQFDNPEDLKKYPRNPDQDAEKIARVDPNILIFSPSPFEVYGEKVVSEHFFFDGLEDEMEGKFRKGHFDGVGTVVKKLFEIVEPDKAFFGEKDFQQLQIIKKMVQKLQLPIEVIGCPIAREENGLARSSRNERLPQDQRENAAFIFRILQEVQKDFGTKSASEIGRWVSEEFKKNPSLDLEYFQISDTDTLRPIQIAHPTQKYRAFIAAYSGKVRLIDNIALN